MSKFRTVEYMQGYDARMKGQAITNNPYFPDPGEPRSDECLDWRKGWLGAEQQIREGAEVLDDIVKGRY